MTPQRHLLRALWSSCGATHHERPAVAALEHDGVLDGHRVVGQLVDDPLANLDRVSERLTQAEGEAAGDARLAQALRPEVQGRGPVARHEGAQVRDNARAEHDVPRHVVVLLPEVDGELPPAGLLAAQPADQLFRAHELGLAVRDLVRQRLLLLLRLDSLKGVGLDRIGS